MVALNVSLMSLGTYQKCHEELSNNIHKKAWTTVKQASKEETSLTQELSYVKANNISLIVFAAKGAWSKRAYNVIYDAASGVGSMYEYY